jgi:predicted RNase H-like nuclease (RuvC/YqgF family)
LYCCENLKIFKFLIKNLKKENILFFNRIEKKMEYCDRLKQEFFALENKYTEAKKEAERFKEENNELKHKVDFHLLLVTMKLKLND